MVEGAALGMVGDHTKNVYGPTKIYRRMGKVMVNELRINFALNDFLCNCGQTKGSNQPWPLPRQHALTELAIQLSC